MPGISLHHLHAFSCVAAAGGVRRAAELLERSSSAVACSVAVLEKQLAVPLFERRARGMATTAAGAAVLLRARRIETELQQLHGEALRSASRAGPVGALATLFSEHRLQAAALLAELQHMPSAARVTGVSQPALSQAIAGLESTLGQPLFQRRARGMTPTETCLRWAVRCQRVLAELGHIAADVAALDGVLQGSVVVGTLPLARTLLLPKAIDMVLAHHPKLRVRTVESPYEELCAGLLSGRIDFILGALRPADSGLSMQPLPPFPDQTVLVAGAAHPLAAKPGLTLADLGPYPWVLSRDGTPLRQTLERFFHDHGAPPPEPAVETGDLALLRGLLVEGRMLSAMPAHQLHYEIASGLLVVLPLAMPGAERQIGVTTREGAHPTAGTRLLLEQIRAALMPGASTSNAPPSPPSL
ncbi:LysR family transcriptional regulator [Duganella sp. CT11-25]|uniref:LysR family transcriptional regulator n=1 Tax=unclassified Duganella TaxID=2636909 RepID=UPI0039AFB83E